MVKLLFLIPLLFLSCNKDIRPIPAFYAVLGANVWQPTSSLADSNSAVVGDTLYVGNGVGLLHSVSFAFDTTSGIKYDNPRLFVNDNLITGEAGEITGTYTFDGLAAPLKQINTFYIKVRYQGISGTVFTISIIELKVINGLSGEIINASGLPVIAILKIRK